MIIKQYEKTYLADVADNLGLMLEYAAACQYNPIAIWEKFVRSNVAIEIERGNPKYLAGYSGRDYLEIVINTPSVFEYSSNKKLVLPKEYKQRDDLYWAGYALAHLQYETSLSFYNINKYFPLTLVIEMYPTLHEADIRKFLDIAISKIKREDTITNLKLIRKARGLSQAELAKMAKVDLRSIQMYEQRNNDINKAQAQTLYNISKILGCRMEDLLEY